MRVFTDDPGRSRDFLETGMGFRSESETAYESRGDQRGSRYLLT